LHGAPASTRFCLSFGVSLWAELDSGGLTRRIMEIGLRGRGLGGCPEMFGWQCTRMSIKSTSYLGRITLDKLWIAPPGRIHQSQQVLVDFSVHNWNASSPIQLTGESETHAQHEVEGSLTTKRRLFVGLLQTPRDSKRDQALFRTRGRRGRSECVGPL
jgi:hypothetical protein